MRTERVDVMLEVPIEDVEALGRRGAKRFIIERLRAVAEEKAAEVGGRVLPEYVPEIHVGRGAHVLLGGDYLLLASRWTVEVPDGAVTT